MVIYKYIIEPDDYIKINVPKFSKILSVQLQKSNVCVWILCDPNQPLTTRTFRLAGTGHEIKEDIAGLIFIGTFQVYGGDLVFHLFEVTE